jgi:hypothetical protein
MATLAERIVRVLRVSPRPMDDDELAARIGVIRQAVNQTCRRLEGQGRLRRYIGREGKIVNELTDTSASDVTPPPIPAPALDVSRPVAGQPISEDEIKAAIRDHLVARGFHVEVRWGRDRGIDITASGPNGRWVIEAKGEVNSPQQQGNYFLGALGELVQRMDDPHARYALALPDNPRYRGLVSRLPTLARQRLNLTVFFVTRGGTVTEDHGGR